MGILLLPVKLVLLPVIVVLGVGRLFLRFVCILAGSILSLLSGILGLLGLATILIGTINPWMNGIGLLVLAFLISPFGLPLLAEWLLDRVGDLSEAAMDFVRYN